MQQPQDPSSVEPLETVEVDNGDAAVASVIWLHGLGADGHDFEPVVPALQLPGTPLRYVFPHAPPRAVTINMGMVMRAWFDVRGLQRGSSQDEQGIRTSEAQLRALIRRENERGIPAERIVLAGFSQGGAVALHTGLRYEERLAGILALSTYLPLQDRFDAEVHEANRATPIFQAHGTQDPLVVPERGEETREFLTARGYPLEWRTYPIQHAVSPEEIADVRTWLEARAADWK